MNNIEWKDGAVCYANGEQWQITLDGRIQGDVMNANCSNFALLLHADDFQLNEIREGDYIPASELDTEQKYNEVVDALKLHGVTGGLVEDKYSYHNLADMFSENKLIVIHEAVEICAGFVNSTDYLCKRQLTYSQIIAIGKLKRMMLEGEKSNSTEIPNSSDQVKNPRHYQLVDGIESIEIIARSMTKEQFKGYCLGNMLKYRLRAGKKDALQQDIEKANFYGELYEMHKDKCYD